MLLMACARTQNLAQISHRLVIVDGETGSAISNVTLIIDKRSYYSDDSGAVMLPSDMIQVANCTVNVTHVAYESCEYPCSSLAYLNQIRLFPKYYQLDSFRKNAGKSNLLITEANYVPILTTEMTTVHAGLFNSLLKVSGINTSGEGHVVPYIRGGNELSTGIFIDGMLVFRPFHIFGFSSSISSSFIQSAEVSKSGRQMGMMNNVQSVVQLQTKEIDSTKSIILQMNLFQQGLTSLHQYNTRTKGIVSIRTSQLGNVGLVEDISYSNWDFYHKFSFKGEQHKISLSNFYTSDDINNELIDIVPRVMRWSSTSSNLSHVYTKKAHSRVIKSQLMLMRYVSHSRETLSDQSVQNLTKIRVFD